MGFSFWLGNLPQGFANRAQICHWNALSVSSSGVWKHSLYWALHTLLRHNAFSKEGWGYTRFVKSSFIYYLIYFFSLMCQTAGRKKEEENNPLHLCIAVRVHSCCPSMYNEKSSGWFFFLLSLFCNLPLMCVCVSVCTFLNFMIIQESWLFYFLLLLFIYDSIWTFYLNMNMSSKHSKGCHIKSDLYWLCWCQMADLCEMKEG